METILAGCYNAAVWETRVNVEALEQSYRYASRVARSSGSSFYRAFALLPRSKRRGMMALYAFARQTDDLGDPPLEIESVQHAGRDAEVDPSKVHSAATTDLLARCQTLEAWRAVTARALLSSTDQQRPTWLTNNQLPQHLQPMAADLFPALIDTVRRFQIPPQYLLDLIDGVLADQTQTAFHSFEQLEHYCYQVASTVGLACIHIWGFQPPFPQTAAIDCGVAFQLTNILRDIREDAQRDRLYLPREFWGHHGLSREQVMAAEPQAPLIDVICDVAEKAEMRYEQGWQVFASLSNDGQRMFSMIWRTYHHLLQQIRHNPAIVLQSRIRIPFWDQMSIIAHHFIPPLYRRLPAPFPKSTVTINQRRN